MICLNAFIQIRKMSLAAKCFKLATLNLLLFTLSGCDEIGELIDSNKDPVIDRLYALSDNLSPTDTTTILVEAHDPDDDGLSFKWSTEDGWLSSSSGQKVLWTAPGVGGNFQITVKVTDENNGKSDASLTLTVLAIQKPTVKIVQPEFGSHIPGLGTINIEAIAGHPNGVKEVLFFVDDILLGRDNTSPYIMPWHIEGKSGESNILVQAFGAGAIPGEPGVDSVIVSVEGVTRL